MARYIDADKLIDDIEHSWDMDTINNITATVVINQTKTDIRNAPTIKAVPYCEIAKSILQIRSINPNFECISRKEVIAILWRLIDGKPKEATDE